MSTNLLLKWFVIPDHDYPVPHSDQFFSDLAVSFRGLGLVVNTAVAKHTHVWPVPVIGYAPHLLDCVLSGVWQAIPLASQEV